MKENIQEINKEVIIRFNPHVENFINHLVGQGTNLNDMGRSIHEYGAVIDNNVHERRLEVASKGFNQDSKAGDISLWDIDYTKPNYPTKMVFVGYSLVNGKAQVNSVTSWQTVYPSIETDDAFLNRIGPQLDAMVQNAKDVSEK